MFFFVFIVKFFVTTVFFRTASANLGINCRGSFLCKWAWSKPKSLIQFISDAVGDTNLDSSTVYNSGDHIACIDFGSSGLCLFPQGASLTLEQIKPLINALINHGCKRCGSVPVHFVDQGSNDPEPGILTFNMVKNAACSGNCLFANPAVPTSSSSDDNNYYMEDDPGLPLSP